MRMKKKTKNMTVPSYLIVATVGDMAADAHIVFLATLVNIAYLAVVNFVLLKLL